MLVPSEKDQINTIKSSAQALTQNKGKTSGLVDNRAGSNGLNLGNQINLSNANPIQKVPMTSKGFNGEELDSSRKDELVKTLTDSLIFQDDAHVQQVMAELRVKDPQAWIEVNQRLKVMKSLISPRETRREYPLLGRGSYKENHKEIERNIHRFWAGGPMKEATLHNILAMQERVTDSQNSSTPWQQYLWTSGLVNQKSGFFGKKKNDLDDQLRRLSEAGIHVMNIDDIWDDLKIPEQDDVGKPWHDLNKAYRKDVREKGMAWTLDAKRDLDSKEYDKVKWLSDLVRLVAIHRMGGVYMDTDIGPGTLDLRDHRIYHTDSEGEIPHHAPPFRVPSDYSDVLEDKAMGDTPNERIIRHADANIPVLNYFLASRKGTIHLERELAELFERQSLTSGMGMFGRLFIPLDKDIRDKPTPYAPSEQRMTPWVTDLDWTTEVSKGEG